MIPRDAAGIQKSSLLELGLWLIRLRRRFRLTGTSMIPFLHPGQEILVDLRAYRRKPPSPGDVVLARHPFQKGLYVVKYVSATLEDGRYMLRGANALESTDSSSFGAIDGEQILGRVTSRFP